MKIFTEKSIWKKLIIALVLLVIVFSSVMSNVSFAADDEDEDDVGVWDIINHPFETIKSAVVSALKSIGEAILKAIARVVAVLGDLIESAMNNFMLGTDGFGTAMIANSALEDTDSWFTDVPSNVAKGQASEKNIEIKSEKNGDDEATVVYVKSGYIEEDPNLLDSDSWEVPNMLYSPENIFANNIAMLDVNFLNPNDYQAVVEGSEDAEEQAKSVGGVLHETIKSWYLAFRNIAIVALLSILVYLGIRIVLSSTAEDKAKHKQVLKDWFIALCLIFAMHFIMSATILIINRINMLFTNFNNNVFIKYGDTPFRSNFMGVMRFLAQSTETADAWAYSLIYLVLVFYTISFTLQYLKRVLYIAFYTMISPLVAITYPIDKLGDGRSQAFNKWFKEYVMTMALQPIHLVIYTMLVSSALMLSINSPIYAIVAIGFLIPAEKFIKSLFGVDSTADKGMGSFASGALTMKAMDMLKKPIGKGAGRGQEGGNGSGGSQENDSSKIKQKDHQLFENFGNGQQDNKQIGQGDDSNDQKALDFKDEEGLGQPNNSQYDVMDSQDVAAGAMLGAGAAGAALGANSEEKNNSQENEPNNINFANNNEEPERLDNNKPEKLNNREPEKLNNNNKEKETKQEQSAIKAGPGKTNNELTPKQKYKNMRRRRRDQLEKKVAKKAIKGIAKGALGAGKFVGRTGLRAAGAGLAGTIGLAAGIASGKGLEGALKMGATGAYAGNAIGNNAANLAGRGINKTIRGAKGVYNAKQTYNANKAEDLKNSGHVTRKGLDADAYEKKKNLGAGKETRKRYNDMINEYKQSKGEPVQSLQEALPNSEYSDMRNKIYDYESRGITDHETIFKGLEMEEKYSNEYSHEDIADVMELSQTYGQDAFLDDKKEKQLDKRLETLRMTESQKENIKELLYEANFGNNGRTYEEFKNERNKEKAAAKAASDQAKVKNKEPQKAKVTKRTTKKSANEEPALPENVKTTRKTTQENTRRQPKTAGNTTQNPQTSGNTTQKPQTGGNTTNIDNTEE